MEVSGDTTPSSESLSGSDAEEAELWRELRENKSTQARQKLFDLHSTFARQMASKHFLDRKSGDIEFSDLRQLAYTGLLEALDRYDPAHGAPFRPYARRRISGSILDGLAHMSEMREQLSFRQRARKERLKSLAVKDPEKLDASEAMLALIEMATGLALGFMIEDSGLYAAQDEADTKLSPYESLAWKEVILALTAEISNLPHQEKIVIRRHYLDGLSFEQISKALELSKGRISQIHRAALKSLNGRLSSVTGFSLKK